eukprot:TRINITY_DN1707_c0_g1_i2.p1 TRINITY_DN1707_c0_g1~~TRINITY_DN1707_c0_g1_i2.p1  ORF type:complete len:225 (+),score=38.43 TRINITY_DN1707_c0_g1_i2:102-776(+)
MARVLFALLAVFALAAAQEQCTICQALIGAVEKELENQSTEAEIAHLLEKLCKALPSFNSTCVAVFEAGVPRVINWIETNENSTVVCSQLKLCTSSRDAMELKPASRDAIELMPARKQFRHGMFRANADCQACQAGVKFVESWLAENSTITRIETLFESTVCKFIPNIEATCDAVTEAGVPALINYIEQHENATVCFASGVSLIRPHLCHRVCVCVCASLQRTC